MQIFFQSDNEIEFLSNYLMCKFNKTLFQVEKNIFLDNLVKVKV